MTLVGNDYPDWSTAVNASGNLVDQVAYNGTAGYHGPIVYVGSSPSLYLNGLLEVASGYIETVYVEFFADPAGATFITQYQFAGTSAAVVLNLLVPVIGPYARLALSATANTTTATLRLYQSAVSTSVPTSVQRGLLNGSSGTSIAPGAQVYPFAFIVPGAVSMNFFVPSTTAFVNIVDTTNQDVVWSSGVLVAGDENTNAQFTLPPNQCSLKIDNGGAAAITCNWTVLC